MTTTPAIDPNGDTPTPSHLAMTGLDQLRAALVGREQRGISALMDISLIELSEGRVVFALPPKPTMLNPIGTVHGGVAALLLDSAASCAVHSSLPAGATYATIQLNIHYTRPILPDTPEITGVGEIVHLGRTVATASGTITDPSGRIVAHGTVTCAVRSTAA